MKQRTKMSSSKLGSAHARRVDSDGSYRKVTKPENNKDNKIGRKKLMNFDSLPDYMQDNEFIRDHYRCEWPLNDVALSVFSVHNETLNIWT